MNDSERRAVATLASVYAIRMLGLFMVLPVFALLGPELTGATPALVGLAIGIYGLSQACLQVPFGALSDRLGRKRLIYIGLVIFAAGSLVAGASDHIIGVIVGRALQGAGAIASVLMALVSDLTRSEQRTKAMASIGVTIGLSFSLSLILGPLLSHFTGLSGIFYMTAALAMVAMVIVWKLVPNPPAMVTEGEHLPARAMLGQVLRDQRLLRLDFGIFALHMALTALFIQVPVMLSERLELAVDSMWWFYLTVMVTSFFAMVPFIILGEKKQQMKTVLFGAVALLVIATMALWQWSTSLTAAWFGLFFFFMAFNLLEASLPSLISKESPAGAKGTAMGVYSTSQFFGAFLGGAAGGAMAGWAGADGVFGLMVIVLLAWLVVAGTMSAPRYRDRDTAEFVVELQESDADDGTSEMNNDRAGVNHGTRC